MHSDGSWPDDEFDDDDFAQSASFFKRVLETTDVPLDEAMLNRDDNDDDEDEEEEEEENPATS